ncbi:MAG: hypothetical protein V4659_13800 [Pseudomonadota bacterium]
MKFYTAGAKGGCYSPCQSALPSDISLTPCIIAGVATCVNGASNAYHLP